RARGAARQAARGQGARPHLLGPEAAARAGGVLPHDQPAPAEADDRSRPLKPSASATPAAKSGSESHCEVESASGPESAKTPRAASSPRKCSTTKRPTA